MKFQVEQLKKGLRNYYTYQLQRLLKHEAGLLITDPTGHFGESTDKAIKILQGNNQLDQTGKIDPKTLQVIEELWVRSGLDDDLNYILKGKILDKDTQNPLAGMLVEIWDEDGQRSELVGCDTTDVKGKYEISFDQSDYMHDPTDFLPDVYFIIRTPSRLEIQNTKDKPEKELLPGSYVYNLAVDKLQASEEDDKKRSVTGRVLDPDANPIENVNVVTYHETMEELKILGQEKTDVNGHYTIEYSIRNQNVGIDLRVHAYQDQNDKPEAISRLILNARKKESVSLVIGDQPFKGQTEFDIVHSLLAPLVNNIDPKKVRDRNLELLARKTRLARIQVIHYVKALRVSKEIDLSAELFYGLACENISIALPLLINQNFTVLKEALNAAIKRRVVSKRVLNHLKNLEKKLFSAAIKTAQLSSEDKDRASISSILRIVKIPDELHENIVTNAIKSKKEKQPSEAFWKSLRDDNNFDDKYVDAIQEGLQLSIIAQNHNPMIVALLEIRRRGSFENTSIGRLSDFAQLSKDQMLTMITRGVGDGPVGVPKQIHGESESERAETYADNIVKLFETAFPTAVFAERLSKSNMNFTAQSDLLTFFKNNPAFRFSGKKINQFFKTEGPDLSGIQDEQKLRKELKSWQRIYHLAPYKNRHDVMFALKENGLDSAHVIHSLGKAAFLRKWKKMFPANGGNGADIEKVIEKQVLQIYFKSAMISGAITNVFAKYSSWSRDSNPFAIQGNIDPRFIATLSSELGISEANLNTLFGNQDYCQCEHCRSVYSPAAYFTDLLLWLENREALAPFANALESLKYRRLDLTKIPLSCNNTNTMLPYVDLVNEVLENAVAHGATYVNPDDHLEDDGTIHDNPYIDSGGYIKDAIPDDVFTTEWTAKELAANPEHMNEDAYKILAKAQYPWALPWDLWLEEGRVYLNHLGVGLYELLEIVWGESRQEQLTDDTIAHEILGLTELEYKLVTNNLSSALEPWEWFGLLETGNVVPNPDDPVNPFEDITYQEATRYVTVFMKQAGLWDEHESGGAEGERFKVLLDILDTNFIQQTTSDSGELIHVEWMDDPCDLSRAMIVNMTDITLERTARFEMLRRNLGWTAHELDLAISSFGADDIDEEFIRQLSHAKRLLDKFKRISIEELLVWWGKIDTRRWIPQYREPKARSLYEQLFLNKAVQNPTETDFNLNEAKSELATTGATISDHSSTVTAALNITEEDLMLLLENDDVSKPGQVANEMNLANLSALFRIVSFKNALKLSVREYLSLRMLSNMDPFDAANSFNTILFTEYVDSIKESEFSIQQLDYLLRHEFEPTSPIAEWPARGESLINEMAVGLQRIFTETALVEDPTGELLKDRLSLILPAEAIEQSFAIINGTEDQLDADEQKAFIDQYFSLFISNEDVLKEIKDALVDHPPAPEGFDLTEASALVLQPLVAHLRIMLSESLIKQLLTDVLEIDADVLVSLLKEGIKSQQDDNIPVMQDFMALAENGLTGKYYHGITEGEGTLNTSSNTYIDKRIDSTIDFDWETKSPWQDLVNSDNFSIIWTAKLRIEKSEKYTFYTRVDDGIRLWVDDKLLIDEWRDQPATEFEAKIELEAGRLYDIRIEFYEKAGHAVAQLSWSSPSIPKQIIPSGQFMPSHIFENALNSFILLQKTAMVITGFSLSVEEIGYLDGNNLLDDFDFNDLPVKSGGYDSRLFRQWQKLQNLFAFRDRFPRGDVRFVDILNADSFAAAKAQLAEFIDYDINDVESLFKTFGIDDIDSLKSDDFFVRTSRLLNLQKRLGVTVDKLISWGWQDPVEDGELDLTKTYLGADISEDILEADERDRRLEFKKRVSTQLKEAAKAKYGSEQWLEIARSLRDPLRDLQRDALVAYLLNEFNFDRPSQLYEHYLIDTEMSSCMLTSRLKQAISSVQLFIQRSLMNLENHVILDEEDGREWQWRKNYRVWEANRKVFLYPENWIEPELRDNKTPFFEDLESELLQNEITTDTVEAAFETYLTKLDKVARLEIVGMCDERTGKGEKLHVFGRTRGLPHIYYYRSLLENGMWTAWESIDVDIEGDHLIPVIFNQRLYLFWPIFKEKTEPETPDETPKKYFEVQMAWSEYDNHVWTAKRLTKEHVSYIKELDANPEAYWTDKSKKRFGAMVNDVKNELYILFYTWGNTAMPEASYRWNEGILSSFEEKLRNIFITNNSFFLNSGPLDIFRDDFENKISEIFMEIRDALEAGDISRAIELLDSIDIMHIVSEILDAYRRARLINVLEMNNILILLGGIYRDFDFDSQLIYTKTNLKFVEEARELDSGGLVRVGWLIFRGCDFTSKASSGLWQTVPFNIPYLNTSPNSMMHTEQQGGDKPFALQYSFEKKVDRVVEQTDILLGKTPGIFNILTYPQIRKIFDSLPFGGGSLNKLFFQDDRRTFFVNPKKDYSITASSKLDGDELEVDEPEIEVIPGLGGINPAAAQFIEELYVNPNQIQIDLNSQIRISNANIQESNAEVQPVSFIPQPMSMPGFFSSESMDAAIEAGFAMSYPDFDKFLDLDPKSVPDLPLIESITWKYCFLMFYHPHVCSFRQTIKSDGIDEFLKLETQRILEPDFFNEATYDPKPVVLEPHPTGDVDFELNGAYSIYNWELFFHGPFLIATALSQNQRFEEAHRWFNFIFNPTRIPSDPGSEPIPNRFWNVLPLFNEGQPDSIIELMRLLMQEELTSNERNKKEQLLSQIQDWIANPFEPHRIARLRISAYQKAVVMKYLDNIIAWADHLFRRDTIESINESTQLYILASNILGRRPEVIERPSIKPTDFTFKKLRAEMSTDDTESGFANALVEWEDILAISAEDVFYAEDSDAVSPIGHPFFCIPHNKKLLEYWDTVDDRLFKIRNCMNIEGVVRQLPLFQPPIDPALLVRAAAAGIDIGSALNDLYAPLPHYRFSLIVQKAIDLCGDVRVLGGALLSALEKKDGEELALLRSKHEIQLLKATTDIRKKQIEEIKESQAALQKSLEMTKTRFEFYDSRKYKNPREKRQINKLKDAQKWQTIAQANQAIAAIMRLFPQLHIRGLSSGTEQGGAHWGEAARIVSEGWNFLALLRSYEANLASIHGGYDRRKDDWDLQADLAKIEQEQLEKQLLASAIRLQVAEKELENHNTQIENAKEIDRFMRTKFTNKQLYSWMVSQISTLYFQSYQLAHDMAKRAQKAFQYELAKQDASYIEFGYWDSLKKGLLSGEKLYFDLKRMEAAYFENNKREYELSKQISLLFVNPQALIQLRETGSCFFDIPEMLFDLDYPGHYMRRIKSVSITLPCVTGPYTSVNAKLTLMGNRIRKNTNTADGYAYSGLEDSRFTHNLMGGQSIATSSGQNDSGMFEINFRDERYLPFERAGAISSWRLELPDEFRHFDYDTISDVIIHMNYTARDGGDLLKQSVVQYMNDNINNWVDELAATGEGLYQLVSLKHEFPTELHQFLKPPANQIFHSTNIKITKKLFPQILKKKNINIKNIKLIVKLAENITDELSKNMRFSLKKQGEDYESKNLRFDEELKGLYTSESDFVINGTSEIDLILKISEDDLENFPEELLEESDKKLNPNAIKEIILLTSYTITS